MTAAEAAGREGSEPELVEAVLDLVRATAGPAAEGTVQVDTVTEALTRFADSAIHQNVAGRSVRLRLRICRDRQWAEATTTRVDPPSLRELVAATLAAAGLRPPDPGCPGLAPPAPPSGRGNWDEATAAAGAADRAALVARFVAASGLPAAGYCATGAVRSAFGNTAGQRVAGRCTAATVDGIARTTTADGSARRTAVKMTDLPVAALGLAAGQKARAASDPIELSPGEYPVVLEPGCTRDLLAFLAQHCFNAWAVVEGRSPARLGEQQFDPALSFSDDATDAAATSLPHDAEGTPHQPVRLVVDGVSTGLLHDRRTALALGTTSTGNAVAGGERWGPQATELRLAAGTGGSVSELVSGVDHGLLVTDFWYTRILDPRTLVVTGLTRNGVWLVEGGRLTRAVRNLRFTQSYLDALAPGAVLAVGSEAELGPDRGTADTFTGGCAAPALRLSGWRFTGGASG